MSTPPRSLITIFFAAAPLLLVLYLMVGRRWGGSKAGPAGWLAAAAIALVVFGANGQLLLVATGRAVLLSLFVLYIIWMALLLYHVVNEAGAIKVIGEQLPGLAPDRPGQALLLAWIFGSFLQGASGFGVPAAIVAPLLGGLGFSANVAVAVALIGHGWAVTFGSLGSSFISLIAATGVPGEVFASETALFMAVCCLGCGLGVLLTAGGRSGLRKRGLFLLLLTLVMGGVQWLLAVTGFWTLAALGAGLAGILAALLDFRFSLTDFGFLRSRPDGKPAFSLDMRTLFRAFMPYILLIGVILTGQLLLGNRLDFIELNWQFPAVRTSFGWEIGAGPGRSISLFGHAGALLLYAAILSFLWFRWRGTMHPPEAAPANPSRSERDLPADTSPVSSPPSPSVRPSSVDSAVRRPPSAVQSSRSEHDLPAETSPVPGPPSPVQYSARTILQKTVRGSVKSTISIITLVAMAVTMEHAGMTQLLAETLSATGRFFPFLSPFIGALGAFMTGSNTNSNVVFGQLQLQTADALGLVVAVILAAQTAGGAIGSVFAPAKVIVGSSTVPGAEDGQVLKLATLYGLGILVVLGVLSFLVA
jgi:lactate permease